MDIKDLLRRLRKVPNKSKFAKDANVGRATLYRLLDVDGCGNPSLSTLRKIEAELRKQ